MICVGKYILQQKSCWKFPQKHLEVTKGILPETCAYKQTSYDESTYPIKPFGFEIGPHAIKSLVKGVYDEEEEHRWKINETGII